MKHYRNPVPDHGETSYKGSGKLKVRKALIIGVDSGIGRAAAIVFAREGADVAIAYLPAERYDAEQVIKLIKAEGRTAVELHGDITREDWCHKLVATAIDKLGGLDILVINARRWKIREGVSKVSTDDFDCTMKTNLYVMHWITQAATPHLPPGTVVIITASIQAY